MTFDPDSGPLWLSNSNAVLFLRRARSNLEIALQPIVDINTGETVAFESLVRGYGALGFHTIDAMFSHAVDANALLALEACVIEKALAAFAPLRREHWSVLFLNLDGRTLSERAELKRLLDRHTEKLGLEPADLCLELSERNRVLSTDGLAAEVSELRNAGYSVAIDDFGIGDSGLQVLYQCNPSFLKIDRFFVSSIQSDRKKKLMVAAIVDMAHSMGVRVIAEGVETVPELHACREVRCDLVQGHLVDCPRTEIDGLHKRYPIIVDNCERRPKRLGTETIRAFVEPLRTLSTLGTLVDVFEVFKSNPEQNIIPIVDGGGVPRGIVREKDLKPFVYSPYGRDLLRNASIGLGLRDFIRAIPTTDINSQLAPLLDLLCDNPEDGILVTEGIKYKGILPAAALARLANEMRLEAASDRNPLTRLPGNSAIKEFIDRSAAEAGHRRVLCLIDIDNFKSFNDKYGFRTGDRAILLLSERLKALQARSDVFVGHVGGDDFFVGAMGAAAADVDAGLAQVQAMFLRDAEALYAPEDREAGFVAGRDREGRPCRFALLSATVAVLEIPAAAIVGDPEQISNLLAVVKEKAKRSKGSLLKSVAARAEDFEMATESAA
ncbi:MAG: GGDEF domain-containing protein [Hyphomicrobiaceae bacterium]|nr:GGDEF domain-containing protein [Hyphomicrobiaceae bacterium]